MSGWPAAVAETHVSIVFFVGEYAYKMKKAVITPFLDYSSRESRQAICHEEVRLNRRLAPDVYLGVADVTGPDGTPCEHLVVMRRLPDDRRLSTLAAAGLDCRTEVREVARRVAAFHAAADRSEAIDRLGDPDAVRRLWVDNFAELTNFASVLDRHVLAAVEMRALAYLDGRCHLLEGRVAHGHIVDGHGDLLTDDIFCLSDGPRILDCLEFDPRLRAGDVLLDLAFLAMDLEHLGRPDLAVALVDTYCELSAEHHPRSLAHHYIAYRALVRAKVSCLRALQAAQSTAPAAAFLDLCARHLHAGAVRLVLVGGLPGTGKTTLAGELGKRLGWVVLRSDEVRKELAGLDALTPSAAPYQEGLYTPAMTARTYSTMLERAEVALGLGESVVLDASWGDASDRDAARTVASRASAELVEVVCELDEATAARRIGGRGPDASDATPAVAHAMAAAFAPWPEAQRADTGATAAEVASAVLALMGLEGPSNS